MKSMTRFGTIIGAMVMLGGCALNTGTGFIADKDGLKKCTQEAELEGSSVSASALPIKPEELDRFLDCFVGPAVTKEEKIFRGHIIVTLFARYGAFNLTGEYGPGKSITFSSYAEIKNDAARLLANIENAESELRKGTRIFSQSTTRGFDHTEKLYRIFAVADVAIEAETPTVRRARGYFENLVAAFSGSPFAIKTVVKDLRTVFKKVSILHRFGAANRLDAKVDLCHLVNDGKAQHIKQICEGRIKNRNLVRADWNKWDNWLNSACDTIAKVAGAKQHCVPN